MKKFKLLAFVMLAFLFGLTINVNAETANVAKVGETEYATIQEAVSNAPENSTVVLLKDLDWTTEAAYVPTFAKGVTFDLNDHEIKLNHMGIIFQGDNLTIKNGKITSTANYSLWIGDGSATTNVTVEDVVVASGINIYKATATLKDVTAVGTGYYAVWTDTDGVAIIESGNYSSQEKAVIHTGNTSTETPVTIKGGTFTAAEGGVIAPESVAERVSITGGEFNADVSSMIENDYEKFEDENGNILVAKPVTLTLITEGVEEGVEVVIPQGSTLTAEEIETVKEEVEAALDGSGLTFDDFYADDTYTTKFDWTQPINADAKVYMKFVQLRENEEESNSGVTNPNTSDINLYGTLGFIILAALGLGYTIKKRRFN